MCHSIVPFFQPIPLLAAPTVRLALPVPRIAGLLPASTRQTAQPYFVFDRPLSRQDILRELGVMQSEEEMDAELIDYLVNWKPSRRSTRSVSRD